MRWWPVGTGGWSVDIGAVSDGRRWECHYCGLCMFSLLLLFPRRCGGGMAGSAAALACCGGGGEGGREG